MAQDLHYTRLCLLGMLEISIQNDMIILQPYQITYHAKTLSILSSMVKNS